MVLMREYSHPEWDMTLFTPEEDGEKTALDILGEGNGDPELLTFTHREMTQEEVDALSEFDG